MADPQIDIPTSMPTSMPAIPSGEEVIQRLNQLWEFLTTAHTSSPPDMPTLLEGMAAIPWIEGIVLALFGVIYLIWGERIFKILVILNAAFVGAIVGGWVSLHFGYQETCWIGMLAGAAVLGLLSWPLVKLFVAIFGGMVGAGMGFVAFADIVQAIGREDLINFSWIGAAIGGAALAVMALFLFRAGIMLFTSLQGASMVVSGGLCLLLKTGTLGDSLRDTLIAHPHILPAATGGLALVGLILQIIRWARWKRANAASASKDAKPATP